MPFYLQVVPKVGTNITGTSKLLYEVTDLNSEQCPYSQHSIKENPDTMAGVFVFQNRGRIRS